MAMIEFDKIIFNESTGAWSAVNSETGETKDIVVLGPLKKASTPIKKKKGDDDPVAKLTLEENKYSFNNAAIELMGIEPDMKIHIKYETSKFKVTPVIGTNDAFGVKAGNRLTKSFTVSCKGSGREELAKFGTIFLIEPHPSKANLFILKGDAEEEEVEVPEEIELPDDVPFSATIDDEDASLEEILSSDFTF